MTREIVTSENREDYIDKKMGINPYINLYHGTPHEIKGQFDISKVGSGSGKQAYGHGIYLAENPEIAKLHKTEKGHIYNVLLHNKHLDSMLDWDKSLSEQSPNVIKKLKNLKDPYINLAIKEQPKLSKNGEYWTYMGNTYESKKEALQDATPHKIISGYTNVAKNPIELGKKLNKSGIKGIHFLDATNGVLGNGTKNYVVFDPSILKIAGKI